MMLPNYFRPEKLIIKFSQIFGPWIGWVQLNPSSRSAVWNAAVEGDDEKDENDSVSGRARSEAGIAEF